MIQTPKGFIEAATKVLTESRKNAATRAELVRALGHFSEASFTIETKRAFNALLPIALKEGIEAAKATEVFKEHQERIDELSRRKMVDYVKAATVDREYQKMDNKGDADAIKRATDKGNFAAANKHRESLKKGFRKSDNRARGIDKALNKLAKEDAEPVVESTARRIAAKVLAKLNKKD